MKIGIIGFGDMGRSLITGLIKQGVSAENIVVCDKIIFNNSCKFEDNTF